MIKSLKKDTDLNSRYKIYSKESEKPSHHKFIQQQQKDRSRHRFILVVLFLSLVTPDVPSLCFGTPNTDWVSVCRTNTCQQCEVPLYHLHIPGEVTGAGVE